MEMCSKLHSSLIGLSSIDRENFKHGTVLVNSTNIVSVSMQTQCANDIVAMKAEEALAYLEDKIKLMGLNRTSLAQGSPFFEATVELRLIETSGKSGSLSCNIREYPGCCGSALAHRFFVPTPEHAAFFPLYLDIVADLLKIAGYSNFSCILSSHENIFEYNLLEKILKDEEYKASYFSNRKSSATCCFLTKNL